MSIRGYILEMFTLEKNNEAKKYGYFNYGYHNYAIHTGDVHIVSKKCYQQPDSFHKSSFLCYQCSEWTWKETELCIHCGYNIANHLSKENIEYQYQQLKQTEFWVALKSLSVVFIILFLMVKIGVIHGIASLILPTMLLIPIRYFDKQTKQIKQHERFLMTEYARLTNYQFVQSK